MAHSLDGLEDTIVAISTPLGPGGIGVVRMSGAKALAIADRMFVAKGKVKPSRFRNYTVHYGWVVAAPKTRRRDSARRSSQEQRQDDGTIDEVLLTVMRRPTSYTREDVVEISCHGGAVAARSILALAVELGARLAEPGEFTKRAFLNGRIDLTQAEAVLDIVQAKSEAFLRVTTHQLKGELSVELEAVRETLMNVYAGMEAVLNFPDDDVASGEKTAAGIRKASPQGRLREGLVEAGRHIERLLKSGEQGRIIKEGIKIVLCGRPNVGKSSLLNVLLRQPRAIVTEVEGTTRDTIEETLLMKGIPFQVVDTAGILRPRDRIEEEAVKRSRMHIESADLVLLLMDGSQNLTAADRTIIENTGGRNVLPVINKCDLKNKIENHAIREIFPDKTILRISALKNRGIDKLQDTIVSHALQGREIDTTGLVVSNMRHIAALKNCHDSILKAAKLLRQGLSLEFISEEVKTAIQQLDRITGRAVDRDVLERIFSDFCIGK